MERIEQELEALRGHVGARMIVHDGKKSVNGVTYHAVVVDNVSLSQKKFNVSKTRVLILLPPSYPEAPPIGFYVHFPWTTDDHHFTQSSYYGAPDLRESDGYYWYCGGLGGGFSPADWSRSWRPTINPSTGHNLITLLVSAQATLNT